MNLINSILHFKPINRPEGVSIKMERLIMLTILLSSIVFFKKPFEFYFHYLIFLGILPFLLIRYKLPKYVYIILLFTFSVGMFYVVFQGFDLFTFIKVWGGLTLSLVFYSLVIQYFRYDVNYIFNRFIQWAYYSCLIGLIQLISYHLSFSPGYSFSWILNKWKVFEGGVFGIRINSIFSEPSTLAVVLAPLAFLALYNLVNKGSYILNKWQSLLVLFVYLGSSSSTGYIGLFISILLVTDGIKIRYALIGLSIALVSGWVLYNNVDEFRVRVDSSLGLWYYQDFSIQNTNTSSFVLYNSYFVAKGSLADNPIFGTGLGSYAYAYDKYTLTKTVIEYDFEFNKTDGNSMLLRLMVEGGLLGVIGVFVLIIRGFIWRIRKNEDLHFKIVSHAILVMIALYLLRQGNYFLNALPLFYLIYYYNWRQYLLLKSSENLIRNENRHPI